MLKNYYSNLLKNSKSFLWNLETNKHAIKKNLHKESTLPPTLKVNYQKIIDAKNICYKTKKFLLTVNTKWGKKRNLYKIIIALKLTISGT